MARAKSEMQRAAGIAQREVYALPDCEPSPIGPTGQIMAVTGAQTLQTLMDQGLVGGRSRLMEGLHSRMVVVTGVNRNRDTITTAPPGDNDETLHVIDDGVGFFPRVGEVMIATSVRTEGLR